METRANYVWVGAVSLALLGLLALFIVWLAQLGTANRSEYDIFFEQSVGGLANAALQDLKRTSAALRSVTERIETQGAGSLVGGSKLPDYKP